MKIDILTLFPKMFSGPFDYSILRRAQDKLLVEIEIHNLRDWATDKYKSVDDRPYGGGAGMIMRVDIIDAAVKAMGKGKVILLDAGGEKFNQKKKHFKKQKEKEISFKKIGKESPYDFSLSKFNLDEELICFPFEWP